MSVSKGKYKKITTNSLQEMKRNDEKISMLTAYDYTLAKIVDLAGVDIILVGDSYDDCQKVAIAAAKNNNKVFIHPFDDPDVIAGQGTIAIELEEQLNEKPYAILV